MAGSTPASAIDSAVAVAPAASRRPPPRPHVSPAAEAWRRFRRHKLAVAGAVVLVVMVLMVGVRAAALEAQDQRHRLHRAPQHADRRASLRHRRPRPGHLRAHALRRPHLARRRPRGDADGDARRRHHRRDRRHLARAGRRGADVAHRPVPVAAAAAAAADPDLSLPRRAEAGVRPGGRRLHPDRARHRRLSLDAGRAAGAGAVLLAAREGIRRGGARARRVAAAPGRAPHPAQLARPGDRRRHHRRRRGDHRGVDAVVPRPRLSARHPDLGPDPLRRKEYLDIAPHWALFPGTAIFLAVLCINFVGDGLRDALDPRGGCCDGDAALPAARCRPPRVARAPAEPAPRAEAPRRSRASRPTSRPTTAGCMPSTASTSPSIAARRCASSASRAAARP